MTVLGIDAGGTGCKCAAFDENGVQKSVAYMEYPLEAGFRSLSPELLFDCIKKVIVSCTERLEEPGSVRAVSVTSFGESFVAVDRNGAAIGDIIMYFANSDSSEFEQLIAGIGPERFMDSALIYPDSSYSLAKMLYTVGHTDRQVWKFLFIGAYITWRLSGVPVSDVSLAARSLLYDVRNRRWSDELVEAAGILSDTLPEVLPAGTILGKLLPELAEELGLPESVLVVLGAHDQQCNALGAGIKEPGEALDSCGTCECLVSVFNDIPVGREFQLKNYACVPYIGGNGYATYAYNISAGADVKWIRDVFGCSYDELNRLCPQTPGNITVLPFLQGMGGTPDVNISATGSLIGVTTQTRFPDIYRAVLEGVAFEMRYNMEILDGFGVRRDRLYACGGGARSDIGMQIKADVFGCPVTRIKTEETGALGAAVLALSAVTGESAAETASRCIRKGECFVPGENSDIYNEKYRKYKRLRDIYIHEILQS